MLGTGSPGLQCLALHTSHLCIGWFACLPGIYVLESKSINDHLDNKEYCEDKVSERLEKDDI